MKAARSYFPSQQITDETAAEYAGEWVEMARKYGIERFHEGLVMARRFKLAQDGTTVPREFFPLPGEIEQFIRNETKNPVIAVTDPGCKDCGGTGWEYLPDGREVKRCHCRKLVARLPEKTA